jgi:large subunit ribosomal protein L24
MPRSIFRRGSKSANPEKKKICRLTSGDRVQVITGKHRTAIGKVTKILTRDCRVLVESVNKVIRHVKANAAQQQQGGRIETEAPIHVSNVALLCPKCMKPSRVGYEFVEPTAEGAPRRKVRVCKRCKARIDD